MKNPKERFKVLRFTLPDGRKMLHVSKWSLFGKRKWAYLFEVKGELDLQTNKPIPWAGATVNGGKAPDETGAKIVTINPSSEFGKLPIREGMTGQ